MSKAEWRSTWHAVRDCERPGMDPAQHRVLVSLLKALAMGTPVPAQEPWAVALGMGVASLRAALVGLRDMGVLSWSQGGSAPARYHVDAWLLLEWVAGRAELSCENEGTSPAAIEGQTGPRPAEIEGQPRARAFRSSSSSSFSPSPFPSQPTSPSEPSPLTPQALHAEAQAMISVLRYHGLKLSPARQEDIRTTWAGHFTLDEVRAAANVADAHAAHNVEYILSVMLNKRAEMRVIEFGGGAAG